MKQVTINPKSLPIKTRYLCDNEGKLDLLGHLIQTLHPQVLFPLKCRTPDELGNFIYPFTVQLRNKCVITPLSFQLLQVTNLPREQQIREANKLLAAFDIVILSTPS